MAAQWEGLPDLTVVRAGSRRDLASGGATAVLCRHEAQDGRLRLSCWKEGSATAASAEGEIDGGLSAIVTRVGQALQPGARPAPEIGDAALRAYAGKDFIDAARLAPDFGYAYTDGAAETLLTGDRATADRLIADGLARAAGIGEIARARLYLLSGSVSQNRADQIAALRQLTGLIPAEPEYWQRLAQVLAGQKAFVEAADAQERVAALRPDNPDALNQLAYLRSWSGDATRARSAALQYDRASNASANAADTLGEVSYYTGAFADAEKHFLESMARDPNFFGGQGYFKAAMARLRLGEPAKAEAHYRVFAEKAGAGKEFLLAQWRYLLTGDAIAEMEQAAKSQAPEIAAAAYAQLAVWHRFQGKTEKANTLARKSLPLARSPVARRGAQTAFFVTLPRTNAVGWRERTDKALPGPALEQVRRSLTLDALIAQGEFAEALPLAQKMFDDTIPPDDRAPRIYLAWCLYQTGDAAKAAELMKVNPIPAPPIAGPFDSVLLRQELELRRALAAR